MILTTAKAYLPSVFPYVKEVDRGTRTTICPRSVNRAPFVYRSAARILTSSSSHHIPIFRVAGPTAAAVALRLSYAFSHRSRLAFHLISSLKSSVSSRLGREWFEGRQCTNTLIAANVLVHIAQRLSGGKLLYWGAKTNDLISKRQMWRLVTSSFLHINIGHLMASCYWLNGIGPSIEELYGPRTYLAVYITSAIAGSGMSYLLCKATTVGASGAIYGLIGSCGMLLLTDPDPNPDEIEDFEEDWRDIYVAIVTELALGVLLCKGKDTWRRVGGMIGGAAAYWIFG